MSNKQKGVCIVISAPSGCGKTTVVKELLKKGKLSYSISATTRVRRKGERNGKDYFFLREKEFKRDIKNKKFLEWAKVFDYYYGTPRIHVKKLLNQGKDVLLDIDVQGARKLMKNFQEAIFIFMLPPSMKELKKRLINRKSDSPKVIEKRFSIAKQEIQQASKYDYLVVNKKIKETVQIIEMIIKSEKYKYKRTKEVINVVYST
ncbi:guanylate kinase [Candidatus Omnitrophota bacterium]